MFRKNLVKVIVELKVNEVFKFYSCNKPTMFAFSLQSLKVCVVKSESPTELIFIGLDLRAFAKTDGVC